MTIAFESFIDELMAEIDKGSGDTVSKKHIEEEQAFIILEKDPKPVVERLAEFSKLGTTHKVGTGKLIHIKDTFYDMPEGEIRKSKNSLRVREANGVPFVTLKGKNQALSGSKRTELEVEWPWQSFGMPSPHDVAELFGMEKIQTRETERIARDIYRSWDETIIAELAIDRVTYDFGDDVVPAKVYEVEIEMKSDKGATLKTLSDALRKKFDGALWPWDASKFAMGKTLEHALSIELDDDGFLTAGSFYGLANLVKG